MRTVPTLVLFLIAACAETPVQDEFLERVALSSATLQGQWLDATVGFATIHLDFLDDDRFQRITYNQGEAMLQIDGTFRIDENGWLHFRETRRDADGIVSENANGLSQTVSQAVLLGNVLYLDAYCRINPADITICDASDESGGLSGSWMSPYQISEPHSVTDTLTLREEGRLILTLDSQNGSSILRTVRDFYDENGNLLVDQSVDQQISGSASPVGSGVQLSFPEAQLNERLIQSSDGDMLAIVGTDYIRRD